MAAGGALGAAGYPLPFVKIGIALSVVTLGTLVAFGVHLSTAVAMAVGALFVIFHGHAHVAKMPKTAAGLAYGLGSVAATALHHPPKEWQRSLSNGQDAEPVSNAIETWSRDATPA